MVNWILGEVCACSAHPGANASSSENQQPGLAVGFVLELKDSRFYKRARGDQVPGFEDALQVLELQQGFELLEAGGQALDDPAEALGACGYVETDRAEITQSPSCAGV